MNGTDGFRGAPVAGGAELICRTGVRRAGVRAAELSGVDAVEAGDDGLTLTVTFLGKAPEGLRPGNIRIDGGRRITGIEAVGLSVEREEDPELDDRLHITVDRTGDGSRYRLSVVETDPYGRPGTEPFPGFDQRYFSAGFVFRVDCPSPFGPGDAPERSARTGGPVPVVDYTARDYDTVRALVLDRLALTAPEWVERNPADLGTTLAELVAYTADRISHHQDAVSTEAYLDTARRRVSVRRHVRLVDYTLHDGCAARAFVVLIADRRVRLAPGTFRFAAVDLPSGAAGDPAPPGAVLDDGELAALDERGSVEVFEPVPAGEPLVVRPGHNTIRFWTWGEEVCGLPRGATSATLRDEWTDASRSARLLELVPGDLLLVEEVRGARSGTAGDARPAHRQAVRLTSVTPAVDRLVGQPVLEVAWAREDALGFPVRLAVRAGPDCVPVADVSVARGNVVLVDHGRSTAFGGGAPPWVTVPPVPAVPGSCDPPCGCADPRPGNATAALLAARIEQTGSGRLLTAGQVRELFGAVGEEACGRAGLGLDSAGRRRERVVPGAAREQADVVRTLLARSVYPGIVPRFRPVLRDGPVAQVVPFPEPGRVARGQAERLAGIPGRVRERLVELWRGARDHDGLTEPEIAELAVLFGLRLLERIGLRLRPVRALRELLHRSGRLLAGKARRLEVLSARARAGTVLDASVAWEIAQSWGPRYAWGLRPDAPVLRGPAAAAVVQDARAALPAVTLVDGERVWSPRRDLLGSGPRDRHVVGELEDDGRIALRFGDGRYGARPRPGARLGVRCRVGGGTAGNVGAEAIGHLVVRRDPGGDGADGGPPVVAVRNPLPAVGGTDPEPLSHARQSAPLAPGRTLLRAVTAEDYAELAGRVPGVARAAAVLRWTGGVREAHVAVDATGTAEPPPELLEAVEHTLERFRRIGHDLVVGPARNVPLEVVLRVCAAPGHQQGRLLAEVYRLLGCGRLPGGEPAFFHPDALAFGEPVRLSRLVAVAAGVPGVESVRVTRLARLFRPDPFDASALEEGVLRLGPLEIARCDNDPERPEWGRLSIELEGGAR
ncbi:putative baseplate assembly protein [Streptomyces sp. NPDC001985]|uniref:putative baseplate assembly protein n=1 Tax=Streptomyces sp. NPDC001985 TaxID=3154406 RepID=UPI00332CFA6B